MSNGRGSWRLAESGSPISGLKMANFSTFFEFVLTGVAAGTVAIVLGVLLGSGNRRK